MGRSFSIQTLLLKSSSLWSVDKILGTPGFFFSRLPLLPNEYLILSISYLLWEKQLVQNFFNSYSGLSFVIPLVLHNTNYDFISLVPSIDLTPEQDLGLTPPESIFQQYTSPSESGVGRPVRTLLDLLTTLSLLPRLRSSQYVNDTEECLNNSHRGHSIWVVSTEKVMKHSRDSRP